ncbi:hypothetical protein PHYSODRAFT_328147 [Phytophthora sojae]|uniref:Uncharacterized protein n=1 Tax=Phytophthora sojae (strain P6497) TaxID=1094619 RepID=G4Z1X7_PHYSP|nr:hypothetical protein PHYSODRAFT_328147 [Phytophthora sojae]EGZ19975.1 hypothetical protein PHYSODRAFT_328147 [Phytophthora sojae]|eukprot:XP_009522692.1 hypothetical protein PHYSODRAFT_328147 [Phytophthora sojae]
MPRFWHQLYRFCASFQVELRGHYSAERIGNLGKYLQTASTLRSLFLCVLSPLPCLVLVTLVDCVPLASPQAGSSANVVFWGRTYLSAVMMARAVLEQISVVVPGLGLTPTQAAVITVVASAAAVSMMIGLSSVVGFPLPFMLDLGTPAWIFTLVLSFGFLFGRKLQQNDALRNELQNFINAVNVPVILMFVYPVYVYGFGRVGDLAQNFYLIILAVIRIVAKNWTSYFLDTNYDLMPQMMTFNVDVFNSIHD